MYTEFDLKKMKEMFEYFSQASFSGNYIHKFQKNHPTIDFDTISKEITSQSMIFPNVEPFIEEWNKLLQSDLKGSNNMIIGYANFAFDTLIEIFHENSTSFSDSYLEFEIYEDSCRVCGRFDDSDSAYQDLSEEEIVLVKKYSSIFKKFIPTEGLVFSNWRDGVQEFLKRITGMLLEAKALQ